MYVLLWQWPCLNLRVTRNAPWPCQPASVLPIAGQMPANHCLTCALPVVFTSPGVIELTTQLCHRPCAHSAEFQGTLCRPQRSRRCGSHAQGQCGEAQGCSAAEGSGTGRREAAAARAAAEGAAIEPPSCAAWHPVRGIPHVPWRPKILPRRGKRSAVLMLHAGKA